MLSLGRFLSQDLNSSFEFFKLHEVNGFTCISDIFIGRYLNRFEIWVIGECQDGCFAMLWGWQLDVRNSLVRHSMHENCQPQTNCNRKFEDMYRFYIMFSLPEKINLVEHRSTFSVWGYT